MRAVTRGSRARAPSAGAVLPPAIVVPRRSRPAAVRVAEQITAVRSNGRCGTEAGGRAPARRPPTRAAAGRVDGMARAAAAALRRAAVGYHRLSLSAADGNAPVHARSSRRERCHQPPAGKTGGRVWGPALQLYARALRRNWGIGDFTDLRGWSNCGARAAPASWASIPLHALFPHNPAHASPYSPSSRLFLNLLYIDVEAIADFAECATRAPWSQRGVRQRTAALRGAELVDYAGRRRGQARGARAAVRAFPRAASRARAQRRARAAVPTAFHDARRRCPARHALFEALQAHFMRTDPRSGAGRHGPSVPRPGVAAVADFARRAARARRILRVPAVAGRPAARRRGDAAPEELGLGVGLYADLAVSVDRGGAEAWASQALYALGASVGAPPDEFNRRGQDWGLPPLDPGAPARSRATRRSSPCCAPTWPRRRAAHRPRDGPARLFWVPRRRQARRRRLRALSVRGPARHRRAGEPAQPLHGDRRGPGHGARRGARRARRRRRPFLPRAALRARPAASSSRPADYPRAGAGRRPTHDLPTLAGWWEGRDLALRTRAGPVPATTSRATGSSWSARRTARACCVALEREAAAAAGRERRSQCAAATDAGVRACAACVPRTQPGAASWWCSSRTCSACASRPTCRGRRRASRTGGAARRWRSNDFAARPRFQRSARLVRQARPITAGARPRAGASAAIVPRATYRLQLHRDFTFARRSRAGAVPGRLGISHLYLSPFLRARPGSTHGYDIVDHGELNPELGTREDFDAPRRRPARPRHGAAARHRAEPHGRAGRRQRLVARRARERPGVGLRRVLRHRLGAGRGELRARCCCPSWATSTAWCSSAATGLAFDAERGSFSLRYYEHRFPSTRASTRGSSTRGARRAGEALPAAARAELASIITAFGHLPARDERRRPAIASAAATRRCSKRRLARARAARIRRRAMRSAVPAPVQRPPPATRQLRRADVLLEAQAYRLAYWRVAADEINYRRFFDINDLAALRMEHAAVFEATHAAGPRPGRARPRRRPAHRPPRRPSTRRLLPPPAGAHARRSRGGRRRRRAAALRGGREDPGAARAAARGVGGARHHRLRFANVRQRALRRRRRRRPRRRVLRGVHGRRRVDFDELVYRASAADHARVAGQRTQRAREPALAHLRADRRTRDFTLNSLRRRSPRSIACFPVYRTYVADSVDVRAGPPLHRLGGDARAQAAAAAPTRPSSTSCARRAAASCRRRRGRTRGERDARSR